MASRMFPTQISAGRCIWDRVNPVFINELRQSPMRRRPLLLLLIPLLGWISYVLTGQSTSVQGAGPNLAGSGHTLEIIIYYLPLFVIPLLTPAIASAVFAREYDQQTWQDLYLTRLNNGQVLRGKVGAVVVQLVGIIALFQAPAYLYYFRQWMGSDPSTASQALPGLSNDLLGVLPASAFVFIGVCASRYCKSRRAALVAAYSGTAAFVLGFLANILLCDVISGDSASSITGAIPMHCAEMYTLGSLGIAYQLCSAVLTVGLFMLVWVSLSEQRGYRNVTGVETRRMWQPGAGPMPGL